MRNVLTVTFIAGAVALALATTACGGGESTASAASTPVERKIDVPALKVGVADIVEVK